MRGWRRRCGGSGALAALGLLAALVLPGLAPERARAAAAWTMHPPAWDFGVVEPSAGPSPSQAFTVTNTGDATLTIFAAGVGWFGPVGTDPELFRLDPSGCFDASPLVPGESCAVEVSFDPTTAGPKSGLVDLSARDTPFWEGPENVITAEAKLSGTGAGAYAAEPPAIAPPFAPLAPRPARALLLRHPPHKTKKRSAGFWFSGSPTATRFLCGLDGAPLAPCGSPVRLRRLEPGAHQFTIVAVDRTGSSGPERTYRWTVKPKRPSAPGKRN